VTTTDSNPCSPDGEKKEKFGYSCCFEHFEYLLKHKDFEVFMKDCKKLLSFTTEQLSKSSGLAQFVLPPGVRTNWNKETEFQEAAGEEAGGVDEPDAAGSVRKKKKRNSPSAPSE
jgi:hypothetical protein